MTNLTILILTLTTAIARSAPNVSEWYCSNGNEIPTDNGDSTSCNSVGGNYVSGWSGNGNAPVSKSFYSLLPEEGTEIQFDATFKFTCSVWCAAWGFHFGNILNVEYWYSEGTTVKIHGRSYYYNNNLKVTTTHRDENDEILSVHTYNIDPSEYEDIAHNKFQVGFEKSRYSSDKIELVDFSTNAEKIDTVVLSQISLYDPYFDGLYTDGHMIDNYIYLRKSFNRDAQYNDKSYYFGNNIEGDIIEFEMNCNEHEIISVFEISDDCGFGRASTDYCNDETNWSTRQIKNSAGASFELSIRIHGGDSMTVKNEKFSRPQLRKKRKHASIPSPNYRSHATTNTCKRNNSSSHQRNTL